MIDRDNGAWVADCGNDPTLKCGTPSPGDWGWVWVVGIGLAVVGAGGAAVNRMIASGVDGVEFIVINTDAQALHHSNAQKKIHIGKDATRGLGAGADPSVGERAATMNRASSRRVKYCPSSPRKIDPKKCSKA